MPFSALNYKKQISKHTPLIDHLAAKRFPQSVLADEAVVFVLDTLQADQGKRVASYTGEARFTSYLSAVVMRLFEDFSRKKFGRLRPPAWLNRLGGMWLVLFKLLCMERKSFPQAVDEMVAYHHLSAETADHMGSTILAEVVDCGHRRGQTIPLEDDMQPTDGLEISGKLEEQEQALLFKTLFHHITGQDSVSSVDLFDLDFKLSGQEKILLKLCYQDGINVSKAGEMVGLSAHQTHGRMRRLLGRIRKTLEQSGLEPQIKQFLIS